MTNYSVKIEKANKRPFQSQEGGMIDYFWYKATNLANDVSIEFGSRKEYKVGKEYDIQLEKTELANGKYRYKEVYQAD